MAMASISFEICRDMKTSAFVSLIPEIQGDVVKMGGCGREYYGGEAGGAGGALPGVAGGAGEGEEEGPVLLLLHHHQGVPHLEH